MCLINQSLAYRQFFWQAFYWKIIWVDHISPVFSNPPGIVDHYDLVKFRQLPTIHLSRIWTGANNQDALHDWRGRKSCHENLYFRYYSTRLALMLGR